MDAGPASPGSPGQPSGRSRGISFRSDHSAGSKGKSEALVEDPRERDRRSKLWTGGTKANPNAALAESQPAERSLQEQFTLQNLRNMQHRDQNGQPIAEPDLSNPTRPRFERPLDTIRSFEKAIDNGYKRRHSYAKQDSEQQWDQNNHYTSRRSSYFGGLDGQNGSNRPNGAGAGYYGQQRPDQGYANGSGRPQQGRYGRTQTDANHASYNNPQQPRPYPQHGYHASHDTVNTGVTNGSDSTGPWANGTDPSSENSSLERGMGSKRPGTPGGMDNGNGNYSLHPGAIAEEQGYHGDDGYAPPAPPPHDGYGGYGNAAAPRRGPIPLGGSAGIPSSTALPSTARPDPEKNKRRSWIKRRFSKD